MDNDPGDITIRIASVQDAAAISRIHIESWQDAYAGFISEKYLESLDAVEREESWRSILSDPATSVWCAEQSGLPLGFASLGPCRDDDAEPGDLEIYTIYLDPRMVGVGLGRTLIRTMLADVGAAVPVTLWVLSGAQRARNFYQRHGFFPDGVERLDEMGDQWVPSIRLRRRS